MIFAIFESILSRKKNLKETRERERKKKDEEEN